MPRGKISTTTTRVRTAPKRKQQRRGKREVVTTTTTRYARRRRPRNSRFRYTPAAYSSRLSTGWYMRQRGASTYVSGHDILSFDSNRAGGEKGIFWAFPCNPVYWTGTQISAVAGAYQSFRPLKLSVTYRPKVGTSESGSVVFGTCFDKVVSPESLVRMLNASNGGFTTQVYNPARSTIHLGTNLQQNMFTIPGSPDDVDCNPFTMLAYTDSSRDGIPGEFVVHYTFKLANPGIKAVYDNSGEVSRDIVKGAGDAISDYTIEQPAAAVNAFTTLRNLVIDGVKYGAGTTFSLAKYGLKFDDAMITFKQIYNTIESHNLLGVIYSYVTGG